MRMKRGLLITGVLTCVLGYCIWTPIPPGYSNPLQVHAAYSSIKLVLSLGDFMERWGICSLQTATDPWWTLSGVVDEWIVGLTGSPVQVEVAEFDGVAVRIYRPADVSTEQRLPGFVYYHGGGWTMGSAVSYGGFAKRLARDANMVVVSVDYRLAPEHPFPACLEDCVQATKHFLRHAEDYGADSSNVVIGVDSAGGHLAAGVTMILRDNPEVNLPKVKLQVLIYPCLQGVNFLTPSCQQNSDDVILSTIVLSACWLVFTKGEFKLEELEATMNNRHIALDLRKELDSSYMNVADLPKENIPERYKAPEMTIEDITLWESVKNKVKDPTFMPLLASNLEGLPPAYIFSSQYDVLRDDSFWYAKRLREAGCDVTHRNHPVGFHGFFIFHRSVNEADEAFKDMVKFIRGRLLTYKL